MTAALADIDLNIFHRYAGLSLPRHVSYPMPTWWRDVPAVEAEAMITDSEAQQPGYDLSLYLHIPFCETLCKFCACNKVIQRREDEETAERTERYVRALQRDIRRLAGSIDAGRPLRQVHYGGGSPTYLSCDQIERIHGALRDAFSLSPDAEVAMEVDPRHLSHEQVRCLRQLEFNRLSMGIQDFDQQAQEHVRRVQSYELVHKKVVFCRESGFENINFDLIYGMPYQTVDTIRETVEQTVRLSPDRIAYYHYAQIPEKVATQRGMDYTRLPDSRAKLAMFLIGLELFEQAGYELIGLDHFARTDEALAVGLRNGSIQRNFQGMTTGASLKLLGVGVSSISHLLDVGFWQNVKEVDDYMGLVEQDRSPVERGKRFSFDDRVRQAVINQFYCTAAIEPKSIEARFDIRFADYFAREISILESLEQDGLVTMESEGSIRATHPLGRVLMRNAAAVFDAYLEPDAYRTGAGACYSANA